MAPLRTLLQRQTQLKVLAMANNAGFTDEMESQIRDAVASHQECRFITDKKELYKLAF